MKLSKLIRYLQEVSKGSVEDPTIVLSSDSEGNSYSPVIDLSFGFYRPETTYNGKFMDDQPEEDEEDSWEPAIVIWPTN